MVFINNIDSSKEIGVIYSLLNSTVINNIVLPVNSHAYYNEYGRCKEAVYDRVFEMSLVILSYITMRSLLIDICKYRRTYEKSYN